MRSSRVDSVAADNAASSDNNEAGGASRPTKSSYVPPHLCGKTLVNEPPSAYNHRMDYGGPSGGGSSGSVLSGDKLSISLKVGAFFMCCQRFYFYPFGEVIHGHDCEPKTFFSLG